MTTGTRPAGDDGPDTLRAHARQIRSCLSRHLPSLTPSNSQAIARVHSVLEEAILKADRDEKLRRKFSGSAQDNGRTNEDDWETVENAPSSEISEEHEKSSRTSPPSPSDAVVVGHLSSPSPNPLGVALSETVVSLLSSKRVTVSTGLAAIAAAAHSLLLSDPGSVGPRWECTGVPSPEKSGGFARPVRPLPSRSFFPDEWEAEKDSGKGNDRSILLRYRRKNVSAGLAGPHVLRATVLRQNRSKETSTDKVTLAFGRAGDDAAPGIEFELGRHINLPSLEAAVARGKAAPALHYVALAEFLGKVAGHWDILCLGKDDTGGASADPAPASGSLHGRFDASNFGNHQEPVGTRAGDNNCRVHMGTQFRSLSGHSRSDFEGDIRPSFGFAPGVGIPAPGNLMGPDHSIFQGGSSDRPGNALPKPRFDPFGPPGGPMGVPNPRGFQPGRNDPFGPPGGPMGVPNPRGFLPGRNDPFGPPGGPMGVPNPHGFLPGRGGMHPQVPERGGDPNPDHLRVPRDLEEEGDDPMFM